MRRTVGYLGRNRSLLVGLGLLGAMALFVIIGHLTVDVGDAAPDVHRQLAILPRSRCPSAVTSRAAISMP